MKIGFDAKRLFFNGSGLGNYSRDTVRILSSLAPHNDYVLFSPSAGNAQGFAVPESMRTVIPSGAAAALGGSLWRSYGMAPAIRRSGVELYHGLSNELPADIRRAGVRSVVTVHDLVFVTRPELYRPADRFLYTRKYGRSCRNADRIVAISRCTADDLVRLWNVPASAIEVIYQGCSPRFGEPVEDGRIRAAMKKYALPDGYVLSVGTVEARKNLMLVLRAMAECRLDVHLVACGRRTSYAERLEEYARDHGLAGRLHLRHAVSFDDLPAIYRGARAFVYPSYYEGFGIPIIEALNCGVPVMTTRGGVFSETGGDACLYVDPDDASAAADAIKTLVTDEALRAELVSAGRRHVSRFSDRSIAEALTSLYSSLLR